MKGNMLEKCHNINNSPGTMRVGSKMKRFKKGDAYVQEC